MVAGGGSGQVRKIIQAIQMAQGIPLSIVQERHEIGGVTLDNPDINLLLRLAQDGAVKPPSITTAHAGENFFLFTPTPTGAALSPTKRDMYERAMAIVAAIRQGQFLPRKYAIRSPGAVIYTLRHNLKLAKATTEAAQQYKKLVHLRIARLIDVGKGYSELRIINTPENLEALDIAYSLVESGVATGVEVDEEARNALQQEQSFVESLVASGKLQKWGTVPLTRAQQQEIETLFLR